jgi:hypothetical protein
MKEDLGCFDYANEFSRTFSTGRTRGEEDGEEDATVMNEDGDEGERQRCLTLNVSWFIECEMSKILSRER